MRERILPKNSPKHQGNAFMGLTSLSKNIKIV